MQTLRLVLVRFWKNKRSLILLGTAVLLVPLLLVFNASMLEKEQAQRIAFLEKEGEVLNDWSETKAEKELEEFADLLIFDDEEAEQAFFAHHSREISFVSHILAYESVSPAIENEYLEDFYTVNDLSELTEQKKFYLPAEYIRNKTVINNELLAHGLEETSLRYGQTGAGFTNFLIQLLCSFPGIFLLLFIFGLGFGEDFENRRIRLAITQPVKRRNYLTANFFWTYFASILFALLLLLAAFGLGTLFFGQGDIGYPVCIATAKSGYFIPLWQYWCRLFGTFCVVYLFYVLVFFSFSILFKKGVSALVTAVLVLFGLNFLFTQEAFGAFDVLNPFVYLDPVKLFVGLDFSGLDLKSAAFSDGAGLQMNYRLFIQNLSYFSGGNLSGILNQEATMRSCLITLVPSCFALRFLAGKLMKRQGY